MSGKNGKAVATKKTQSEEAAVPGLPLFYQKPAALDLSRHAKAGIKATDDFRFARDTNSIPVNAVEFVEASKYYPIVFTSEEQAMPAVLTGFEKLNYFIDAKGKWKEETYIPAYVRKYPFIFTELPERQQLVLCVDEAAPHFKTEGGAGVMPFYEGDKPSELSRNALEFCKSFHGQYQVTRQFCDDLRKHELLTSNQSEVKLPNGRTIRLGGFQLIDEKKLGELSDDAFLDLRKKGWLPYLYLAIISITNWKHLVEMATAAEPAGKTASA